MTTLAMLPAAAREPRRITPKGTQPRVKRHHWRGRRWKWLREVRHRVPRHVLAAAVALAERSNDETSWVPSPGQVELASVLGADERTVRRHLVVLEAAGLLMVLRDRPQRDPSSGRWHRRRTNRYVLTMPAGRVPVDLPGRSPTGHARPVPPLGETPPARSTGGGGSVVAVELPADPSTGAPVPLPELRERIRALKASLD